MPSRRAFTLVEMLTVITILVVLMGLLIPAVALAKRAMQRAKATNLITNLLAAVDRYRNDNGIYPEKYLDGAGADIYATNLGVAPDHKAGKPAIEVTNADGWTLVNSTLILQLGTAGRELVPTGTTLLDPWGKPLRYRPSRWYPFVQDAAARIDSDNPPNPDGVQIWSAGPDTVDDPDNPGDAGDDISTWNRKS